MKKITLALSLSVLSSAVFAQYHNDIGPIREATSAARQIVKDLEVTDMNLVVGAPEYPFVYKAFLEEVKNKEKKFEADLDAIAQKLSYDYSILKAMEEKKKTDAIKQTIKDAENRFEAKINAETAGYHQAISAFITPNQGLMAKCLSVLCINQVMEDYRKWIERSKKINQDICLYKGFALKNMKFSKKNLVRSFEGQASSLGSNKPIAIEPTDERMPYIEKYGIEAFSKFNFADIKKFGLDMLLKHGVEALNAYPVSDLEKYGYQNIRKYGLENLNKHGLAALQKYKLTLLNKYGFELLEKYGQADLDAFGAELLNTHGAVALKKYGVALLMEASLVELQELEAVFGLEDLKAFGAKALKTYPLSALKLYGVKRLETYGQAKLDQAVAKYGIDYVLEYEVRDLDKFGAEALDMYGAEALNKYGLAAIKKFGISALNTWGLNLLSKYGEKNLMSISNPNALIAGRAYLVGWENSLDLSEKHTVCTGVLGAKATAIMDDKWTHHSYYPINGKESYAVAHVSGQMMIQTCPANHTCRGWSKIFCAVEK